MNYVNDNEIPEIWEVGDVILNKYDIREIFTGGGMGLVYRAYHRDWDLELAVKSPRLEKLEETSIIAFEQEAQNWINLGTHPNILTCFYVRRLGDIPRIFSEFVPSGSLEDWLQANVLQQGSKNQPYARILDIAIQFARGLRYAHDKGVVHQDVKPGNLMMGADDTAKVCDFGLARALDERQSHRMAPQSGAAHTGIESSGYYTPAYASPEQAAGLPLTRHTDIWSWAVSVLAMLKGEVVWATGLAAPFVLAEHYGDAKDSDPLAQLLARCLARDIDERPADFAEVLEQLLFIYERCFRQQYWRAEPEANALTADTLNNHAVSLLDLSNASSSFDVAELFEKLREADPFHVDGILNYTMWKWSGGRQSITGTNRDILNAITLPGVAQQIDPIWLEDYQAETLQTSEQLFSIGKRPRLRELRDHLRKDLQDLFFVTTPYYVELSRRLTHALQPGRLCCSDHECFKTCWWGKVLEGDRPWSALRVWHGDGLQYSIDTNSWESPCEIVCAALSEEGRALAALLRLHGDPSNAATYILLVRSFVDEFQDCFSECFDIDDNARSIQITVDDTAGHIALWNCDQFAYRSGIQEFTLFCRRDNAVEMVWPKRRADDELCNVDTVSVSGCGSLLMTTRGARVRLWSTDDSLRLKRNLLDVNLSNFGIINYKDCLPGFDLESAFEGTISKLNDCTLLDRLRDRIAGVRLPYRLTRPVDPATMREDREVYSQMIDHANQSVAQGDFAGAAKALDVCLALRCANKTALHTWRHQLVQRHGVAAVSRGWHTRDCGVYIGSTRSEVCQVVAGDIDGRFILKRVGAIDSEDCLPVECGSVYTPFDIDEESRPNCICAMLLLPERRAVVSLRRDQSSSVAVVQNVDPIMSCGSYLQAKILWEKPASGCCDGVANSVVVIKEVLYQLAENGQVAAYEIATGKCLYSLQIDGGIGSIVEVDWNGRSCLSAINKNSSKLHVFGHNGVMLFETNIDVGCDARFESMALFGRAVVVRSEAHLWHVHCLSGAKTRIWSRWDYEEDGFVWPSGITLSPCGRAVAYIVDRRLHVVDVATKRKVLDWAIVIDTQLRNPCFDRSGRWLLLVHSVNKGEIFEFQWDCL